MYDSTYQVPLTTSSFGGDNIPKNDRLCHLREVANNDPPVGLHRSEYRLDDLLHLSVNRCRWLCPPGQFRLCSHDLHPVRRCEYYVLDRDRWGHQHSVWGLEDMLMGPLYLFTGQQHGFSTHIFWQQGWYSTQLSSNKHPHLLLKRLSQ